MEKVALTDNQKNFYDAVKERIQNGLHLFDCSIIELADLRYYLEENPPLFFLKKKQIQPYIDFFIENKKLYIAEYKKKIYVSISYKSEEIVKALENYDRKKIEEKEERKAKAIKQEEHYKIFKSLPDESQKRISKITNLERKIRRDIEMLEIEKELSKKYRPDNKEILKIEKKIEDNKVRLRKMVSDINSDEKNVICSYIDGHRVSQDFRDQLFKDNL